MRSELDLIGAGFEKMPTLTGNGGKLVKVDVAGTSLTVAVPGTDYATAAQGSKADTAVQPAALTTLVAKTSNTGSAQLPSGTTAERDATPATGSTRFNTDTGKPEAYNGSTWGPMGGGATGGSGDACFYENSQTINNSYTITASTNAMSAGPISISSGATVTIPTGSVWTVI